MVMVALEWPHFWGGVCGVGDSLFLCNVFKSRFRSRCVHTFTSNYKIGKFVVVVSSITFGSILFHFYRPTNAIP